MIGETLGSYKVLSEIGTGGMGVVYLAEHTVLGRKAAVKLLRLDVSIEYVERFFNEAKAAANLHHPGLVDVYDFGHSDDRRAYIVMEYLLGESLAERLAHDPRLPVAIACTIARSVAMSLEVAHQQGIVHRDLKPGNIYLVPDSDAPAGVRTKVLDFGIAKLIRDQQSRGVNTASGAVIGTPRYMSPEQCKDAKNVDGRSDVYSLGCILYEMLLGVAPFDYDSWAELVGAHIYEVPPRPTEIDPKLPADVETLVCKMLEKEPDDRFSSMKQLAESLEVLLRSHGVAPVRLTPPGRISTPAAMRKLAIDDPTLPASSQQLQSLEPKKPITADDKRAGHAPTLNASDTGKKPVEAAVAVKKPPWVAIGIAGAGIAALAVAGAVVMKSKSGDKPAEEPTYVVVDQRGSGEKPIEGNTPPPVTIDAAVVEAVAGDAAVAGTGSGSAKVSKPPPSDLVSTLTRTFAKQSSAINRCYTDHPTTVEGDIFIRFQVDTSGKVTNAEMLPASVGGTPLGACLLAVASRTNFGAQPQAIAFKVPIVSAGH